MGKAATDAMIDGGLDKIDDVTVMSVCSAEPANHAGIAAVLLAEQAVMTGSNTKADGDTSGRKLTIPQQSSVSITATGNATHIVIDDGTDIFVTTCDAQGLTSGGSVTIPAWDIEISDPA